MIETKMRADAEALVTRLSQAPLTMVISGFQGLTVGDAESLRLALRGRATVVAAKNRFAMIAAAKAGIDLGELTGQTALVFVNSEPAETVRDLLVFIRSHPTVAILRGWRDGGTVNVEELNDLAGLAPAVAFEQEEAQEEAQTMFDVVLLAAGAKKIQVIKAIRELTGLGLKAAKDAAESTPFTVLESVSEEVAQATLARLVKEGAEVELR